MGQSYNQLCAIMPPTLLEALASCLVKDSDGNVFLNVICYSGDCNDFTPPFDCDDAPDLEAFVLKNSFGLDVCGNLALKMRVCDASDAQNFEGELQ